MLLIKESTAKNMLFNIECKRKEMITSGEKTGLTSRETLKCSEELDKLIYTYQIQIFKRRIRS